MISVPKIIVIKFPILENVGRKRKCGDEIASIKNGDSQHRNKKSKKQNTFQEEVLTLQREHLKESQASDLRQQQFLERLFEAQREQETREREADRNLLLKLGQVICKK